MSSSPELHIRQCLPGDEAALSLVGQATFLDTFAGVLRGSDIISHCLRAHAVEVYKAWLLDSHSALWLVEVTPGNAPVGFMVLGPADLPLADLSDRDLELKRIYLLRQFQGVGIGSKLIALASDRAKSLHASRLLLGVYAHNASAIAFYEKVGFSKAGHRTFHVGDRDYDDYIMAKDLTAR